MLFKRGQYEGVFGSYFDRYLAERVPEHLRELVKGNLTKMLVQEGRLEDVLRHFVVLEGKLLRIEDSNGVVYYLNEKIQSLIAQNK